MLMPDCEAKQSEWPTHQRVALLLQPERNKGENATVDDGLPSIQFNRKVARIPQRYAEEDKTPRPFAKLLRALAVRPFSELW
jgi:hypothetical protein